MSTKIDSVQGLRGLAALAVVASHAMGELIEHSHNLTTQPIAVALGEAGVRVFFVISGFIMAVTMREHFGQPGAARDFILKRLIRIVPLYWLVTLAYIAVVMVPRGTAPGAAEIAMSLAFVPYLNDAGQWWPIYVPGWTLNYEMLFYGIFAVALFWRRGLVLVFVALGLLAGAGLFTNGFYTRPIVLYFAAGVALALVWHLLPLRPLPARLAAASGILGDASYSVYLTHSFAIGVCTPLIPYVGWAWLPAMLAGSAVTGWLCYRWVELPLTQGLRRWLLPGRVGATEPPPSPVAR